MKLILLFLALVLFQSLSPIFAKDKNPKKKQEACAEFTAKEIARYFIRKYRMASLYVSEEDSDERRKLIYEIRESKKKASIPHDLMKVMISRPSEFDHELLHYFHSLGFSYIKHHDKHYFDRVDLDLFNKLDQVIARDFSEPMSIFEFLKKISKKYNIKIEVDLSVHETLEAEDLRVRKFRYIDIKLNKVMLYTLRMCYLRYELKGDTLWVRLDDLMIKRHR